MEEIDKALLKYDFDSTACTQRVICWYVKESIVNIEENRPSGIDYLIETLSRYESIHFSQLCNLSGNYFAILVLNGYRICSQIQHGTRQSVPQNVDKIVKQLFLRAN